MRQEKIESARTTQEWTQDTNLFRNRLPFRVQGRKNHPELPRLSPFSHVLTDCRLSKAFIVELARAKIDAIIAMEPKTHFIKENTAELLLKIFVIVHYVVNLIMRTLELANVVTTLFPKAVSQMTARHVENVVRATRFVCL